MADAGFGIVTDRPVITSYRIRPGAELSSKIAVLAVLHDIFNIPATRFTVGVSANIRLHSFTWSGVSAGDLPSALARSRPAFIHSLVESESDGQRLPGAARSHWGIENSVHWVLDVSFRENESLVKTGNAPKKLGHNAVRSPEPVAEDRRSKISIKAKRKLAAWDNDYLLSTLAN